MIGYDKSQDTSLNLYDEFEPLSRPIEDYIELPKQVKVHWIGSERDVCKLKVLYNQMYIGIDSEWKPTQFSGESHSKPSLL